MSIAGCLAHAERLFNALERGDKDAAAQLKGAYREAARVQMQAVSGAVDGA